MKQRNQRFENRIYLCGLNLNQHLAQQYILNVSSKVRLLYFFHLKKENKETKCISVKISKNFRRVIVLLSKVCRSKSFVTWQNFIRTLKIHYKKGRFFHNIFDNSHLKFGQMKKVKIKKWHFRQPVDRKLNFFTS